MDGQDVALPWIGTEGLSISRASSTFLLLRWPGVRVLWGVADPAAYITLAPHHAHQVCQEAGEGLGKAMPRLTVTVPHGLHGPGAGSVWHLHLEPAG